MQLRENKYRFHNTNPFFCWLLRVFTVFTGILAGIYPDIPVFLQSHKSIKGAVRAGRHRHCPRRYWSLYSFTISIMLIIATIVVYRQVQFAKGRPMGYDKESLVQIAMNSPEFDGKFELTRERLKSWGLLQK